jgi:peptide/nickel transport system ATP-binding protein
MGAIPSAEAAPSARLTQIPGAMPRLTAIPPGFAFNPRCPHAFDRCRVQRPEPMPAGSSQAACWLVAHDAGAQP